MLFVHKYKPEIGGQMLTVTEAPAVLAKRTQVIANIDTVKHLVPTTVQLIHELQSECRHSAILCMPGYFGSYDPVTDYDDTKPEIRVCAVCNLLEVGKEQTGQLRRKWIFQTLTAEPIQEIQCRRTEGWYQMTQSLEKLGLTDCAWEIQL